MVRFTGIPKTGTKGKNTIEIMAVPHGFINTQVRFNRTFRDGSIPDLGLIAWLDDPNDPRNIIEDGSNKVSQCHDNSRNDNNYVQATALDQPTRTGSQIDYDGSSDFLDGGSITPYNTSAGEIFFVINDTAGAGVFTFFFTFSDASTDDNSIGLGLTGADLYTISSRVGGVPNNIQFGAAVRGTTQIYSFSSSGTAYKLEVNGVNKAVTAGVDDGDWVADNPLLDNVSTSALIRTTSAFYNNGILSIIPYNRQLAAAERLTVNKFLNSRFSLGLSL